MKIALVHEMLTKRGGAERVVQSLAALYPEAPLYTLLEDKAISRSMFGARVKSSNLQRWFELLKSPKLFLPRMADAIERFDFSGYDAVISSSSGFAHGLKKGPARHLCYCHSPMRYAWDYTHEYLKGYSAGERWAITGMLNTIRQWDYRAADRADKIIANSKHVQKRIAKYWRKSSEVIYPPVNVKRFTPQADHDDYFLIVSALTPFKRIDLAIEAFNKIKRKLVIIGEGAQKPWLQSIAGDTIEFLGAKSDAMVADYMSHCRAFIFPGEEDFGITPIEAMAAGKPVLAYGVGGVTESVIEGVTGEFFYDISPDSLIDGLARLLGHEKGYNTSKIRAQAERFDESVFEDKMKKAVEGLMR